MLLVMYLLVCHGKEELLPAGQDSVGEERRGEIHNITSKVTYNDNIILNIKIHCQITISIANINC
jgi:hypothetical protein